LPKFGCYGNSLCSLIENSDSIFEFADSLDPTNYAKDFSISDAELKLYNFSQDFCLNLVAMATPLDPLKFRIAYLNLPTRKTIASNAKIVSISNCFNILYRTKMCAILAYFCPNLVAIATPFAPLKILAYLIHRPRRLDYINEEALSILYIMKFVCLILPKFSSRGNFLASLKILHSTFEFTNPVKPTIHAQNLSISCTEQN